MPIAVPALIRNWWPMVFFCVFKSPAEGRTHIFRPGEPFAQIIVIPEEAPFELEPMTEEEAAERELQARRIYANRPNLAEGTEWTLSNRYGVRRHLSASSSRGQGKGAARLTGSRQSNATDARSGLDRAPGKSSCATRSVPVVAVMMMVVVMVVMVAVAAPR